MSESPVIRPPTPDDAPAVAELHYGSWVATYGPLVAPGEVDRFRLSERVKHWERLLRERPPDRGAFVAERAGRVVGFVEWEIGPDGDPSIGEVHAIHVAPDEQGRGVGALLLASGVEALRGRGAGRAVLWVLVSNAAARRFYEHQGWTWDGTTVERTLGALADFPRVIECQYALDLAEIRAPGAGASRHGVS